MPHADRRVADGECEVVRVNRRSFLRAATGCAVAAPVAIRTVLAMKCQQPVLWAVNLDTGRWRVIEFEEFMEGKL